MACGSPRCSETSSPTYLMPRSLLRRLHGQTLREPPTASMPREGGWDAGPEITLMAVP